MGESLGDLLVVLFKVVLIVAFVVAVFLFIYYRSGDKVDEVLNSMNNFKPNRKVIDENGKFIFAADDAAEKFVYITKTFTHRFDYKDIISVEIIEDGQVTSKKSISRTIGGAIVGGVLAGGFGSVVGGLSGGSKQVTKVSSIVVKILLRDQFTESFTITCYGENLINLKDVKAARIQANQIKDIVSIIIDKIERKEHSNYYIEEKPVQKHNLYDDLIRLNDLLEKGIITEYEFLVQKDKLLKS